MSLFGKSPPSSQHSLESFKAQILSSSCKILESRKLLSPWQNISHLTKSINHLSSKTCSLPVEQPKHMETKTYGDPKSGQIRIWQRPSHLILPKSEVLHFAETARDPISETAPRRSRPLSLVPPRQPPLYRNLPLSLPLVSFPSTESHKSTISFPPSHPVALISILIAKNLHSVFPKLDLLSM